MLPRDSHGRETRLVVRTVQRVVCPPRHAVVCVARQRDTGLREGASEGGYPERAVSFSHSLIPGSRDGAPWTTGCWREGRGERGESASPVPPTAETPRTCTVLEAGHGILGPETPPQSGDWRGRSPEWSLGGATELPCPHLHSVDPGKAVARQAGDVTAGRRVGTKGVEKKKLGRGSPAGNQDTRIPSPKQAACFVCRLELGEHQHCRPVEKRQTGVGILTGER